jgi:hypothetical protein
MSALQSHTPAKGCAAANAAPGGLPDSARRAEPTVRQDITWLVLLIALVLAIAGLSGVFVRAAFAAADYRPQLALELAVVAAHEGALDNVRDTALVWQVLESRRTTDAGRLALLREHSPRALGREPCSGGNCEWSVELLRNPYATPRSVDAAYWSRVRAENWTLVMRKALGLVYGIDDDRPCAGAPYSWGYAGDVASAWLERRLVPMGCEGVLNDGFAFAPRVVDADVAKGRQYR